MESRFLLLAAELARLEQRRREILSELKGSGFGNEERQLVLGILGKPPQSQLNFDDPGPLFRYSVPRRNVLAKIRDLLASNPTREFTATEIKTQLEIDRSNEKSFYSALAKLHKLGQIRRVGRGLYKTATRKAKAR